MRQSLITRHYVLLVVFASLIAVGTTATSQDFQHPDDIYWDNSISPSLLGVNGKISSAVVYNGSLIIAGQFSVAGNIMAKNIAAWNGSTWASLGEGLDGNVYDFAVSELFVYDNKLIATGWFTASGTTPLKYIAAWDGSSWSALGGGLSRPATALAVYNGRLVVNNFEIGGISSIGAWDGTSWARLDTGNWAWDEYPAEIHALVVFDGLLWAGGQFDTANGLPARNIAVWNDTVWSTAAYGLNGSVNAFSIYGSELVAAGRITLVDSVMTWGFARWNGTSWSAVGMSQYYPTCVATFNDSLFAYIDNIGTFVWNGSTWSHVSPKDELRIRGMFVYNNQLLGMARSSPHPLVSWSGSSWVPFESYGMGFSAPISCYQVYDGKLYAGGAFTSINGVNASHIAQWDGNNWSGVGKGMNGQIYSMTIYNNQLIAGGVFDSAGGVAARNIAAWDGSTWSPVASGPTDDTALIPEGFALQVYGNNLIMAGEADIDIGDSILICSWNGSVWTSLGRFRDPNYNGIAGIYALTVHDGKLIAGGMFEQAAGVDADNIAAWDGVSWSALGNGFSGTVSVLGELDGQLVANNSGAISRWNGSSWSPIVTTKFGTGYGYVTDFGTYNNSLIIGGYFDTINGIAANGIIEWNGHTWKTLGSGIGGGFNPSVSALAEYDGALVAGGNFTIAGGKPAAFAATWYPTPTDVDDDQANGLPESFALQQNYPNPFNPSTRIQFTVPSRSHVTVEIINLLGQSVRRLVDEIRPAGTYTTTWNGKDSDGKPVATGVYMYRLTAGEFTETKKMVLIK